MWLYVCPRCPRASCTSSATVSAASLWLTFLDSFPAGTNLPEYRERSEYDCSTCRGFIKNFGNVVEIHNGEVRSVWSGVSASDPVFSVVAAAMDEFVGTLPLSTIFRSTEAQYGTRTTRTLRNGQVEVWQRLHGRVEKRHRIESVGADGAPSTPRCRCSSVAWPSWPSTLWTPSSTSSMTTPSTAARSIVGR